MLISGLENTAAQGPAVSACRAGGVSCLSDVVESEEERLDVEALEAALFAAHEAEEHAHLDDIEAAAFRVV